VIEGTKYPGLGKFDVDGIACVVADKTKELWNNEFDCVRSMIPVIVDYDTG
jgi:hypothetical protein